MVMSGAIVTIVLMFATISLVFVLSSVYYDRSRGGNSYPSIIVSKHSGVYAAANNNNLTLDVKLVNRRNLAKTKTTRKPTRTPTQKPTRKPTRKPTTKPTTKPTMDSGCVSFSTYDAIDNDIAALKNNIADAKSRSHFLGGIVRLAAHDFMDYNKNDSSNPMGPDGCFDAEHAANNGVPSIWCTNCPLTLLYQQKYSHISKADFWIASANAVIRQTSVNNALDLKSTFKWGRKDAASCAGSGTRLPTTSGCTSVENVFLTRMGLEWRDAAVLMGAHTLGRGNSAVRKLLSI